MTVYADILIVLNTLVNYFMLSAVKRISRESTSHLRLFLGALLGGISSLLIFWENAGALMTLIKAIVSFVMVLISFKFVSLKKFIKNTLWLFLISFIFGGLMLAVYLGLGVDALIYTNGIVYFDINMTFLVVCSVLAYCAVSLIAHFTDKKAPKNKEYYVTVSNGGKSVSCTALMDTGNNLREPFSGYPVITADKSVFGELFRDDEKFRLIPISTVGGEGLLKALRPDSFKSGGYITDKVYIAESAVQLNEYKIILNINLEEDLSNEKAETTV